MKLQPDTTPETLPCSPWRKAHESVREPQLSGVRKKRKKEKKKKKRFKRRRRRKDRTSMACSAARDPADCAFLACVACVEASLTSAVAPRAARVRASRWLSRLACEGAATAFRSQRNELARALAVAAAGDATAAAWPPPFNRAPDEGAPLPRLAPYAVLALPRRALACACVLAAGAGAQTMLHHSASTLAALACASPQPLLIARAEKPLAVLSQPPFSLPPPPPPPPPASPPPPPPASPPRPPAAQSPAAATPVRDSVLHRGHELVVRWSPRLSTRDAAAAAGDFAAAAAAEALIGAVDTPPPPPVLSLLRARAAALADLALPPFPHVAGALPPPIPPPQPLPAAPARTAPVTAQAPAPARRPLLANGLRAYTRGAWLVDSSTQTPQEEALPVLAASAATSLPPVLSPRRPVAAAAAVAATSPASNVAAAASAATIDMPLHSLMRTFDGAEAARAAAGALGASFAVSAAAAAAAAAAGGGGGGSESDEAAQYLCDDSTSADDLSGNSLYDERLNSSRLRRGEDTGLCTAAADEEVAALRRRIEALIDAQPRLLAPPPAPLPGQAGALSAWLQASASHSSLGGAGRAASVASSCDCSSFLSAPAAGQLTAAWADAEVDAAAGGE